MMTHHYERFWRLVAVLGVASVVYAMFVPNARSFVDDPTPSLFDVALATIPAWAWAGLFAATGLSVLLGLRWRKYLFLAHIFSMVVYLAWGLVQFFSALSAGVTTAGAPVLIVTVAAVHWACAAEAYERSNNGRN